MPIFVLIIFMFVMMTLDMHDSVVMRSVDAQVAMKLEQEVYKAGEASGQSGISDNEAEKRRGEILATAVANINKKCILDSDNSEQIVQRRIDEKDDVAPNRQPDFIRVVSAGLKLVKE